MNVSTRFPERWTGLRRKLVLALPVLMSFCLSGLFPQAGQAQGVSSSRQPSHPSSPRMGVIESQRSFASTSIYTVIGAVHQSGAYHSQDDTVTLDQLIAAAGGLTPEASPTLRIVRAGQLRFQVYYDPAQPNPANRLLPGDIVIALPPPTATRPTTVPVACVGLLDRPVVLPLDPGIQTVNELAARLGQPQETARAAKVISPTGDAQGRLYPGSVVLFPASLVDRLPLEQPGFLPPTFDLKPFVFPEEKRSVAAHTGERDSGERDPGQFPFPERSPSPPVEFQTEPQDRPVLPGPTATNPFPPVAPSSSVAPLGLKAPGSELFSQQPLPQQPQPSMPRPSQSSPQQQSAQASQYGPTPHGPTLPKPPQLVSMDTAHDSGAPSQHLFAAPSIDGIQASRITSTAGVVEGERKSAGLIFADDNSSLQIDHGTQFRRQPLMRSDTSPLFERPASPVTESPFADSGFHGAGTGTSGTGAIAWAAPPVTLSATSFPDQLQAGKSQAGNVAPKSEQGLPAVKEIEKAAAEKTTPMASAWPMIVGVTALLSCVLTAIVFWSSFRTSEHYFDQRAAEMVSASEAIPQTIHEPQTHNQAPPQQGTHKQTTSESHQINITAGQPQVEESNLFQHVTGHPVSDLVQHRIPMMEEKVVVPSQWPLHGGVVGHRRLILNSAHESVPAPHFDISALAQKSETQKSEARRTRESRMDERQLRRNLRAAVGSLRIDPAEGNGSSVEEADHPVVPLEKATAIPDAVVEKPQATSPAPAPHVSLDVPRNHASLNPISVSAEHEDPEYDIVQPELSIPPAKSPLERALRTLASEKRG